MKDEKDGVLVHVKQKGKWVHAKWVCKECKGTTWKTIAKGKEYLCHNCGKVNTGVLFVWDTKKKGLVVWVPPPPKPVEQTPVERVEPSEKLASPEELATVQERLAITPGDAKTLDIINGVERSDGVEPQTESAVVPEGSVQEILP
jgi:hypothetical protein